MSKYAKLIAEGYCVVSNRHGLVARLDRKDWREHMAGVYPNAAALSADFYRRCLSKDVLEVGAGHRSFPNSGSGPTEYLPKEKEQPCQS